MPEIVLFLPLKWGTFAKILELFYFSFKKKKTQMYNASMQLSNLNVIQRSIFWYDIIHLSPALHPVTNSRCKSPFRTILILTKGDSSQTKFTFIPDIFPSLSLSLSLFFIISPWFTHTLLCLILKPTTHPHPLILPFSPLRERLII